jgi:hypothetical protein
MVLFESRVPKRIFGPKRDEVTGGWKEMRSKELYNFCYSPSKIKMIMEDEMGTACSIN